MPTSVPTLFWGEPKRRLSGGQTRTRTRVRWERARGWRSAPVRVRVRVRVPQPRAVAYPGVAGEPCTAGTASRAATPLAVRLPPHSSGATTNGCRARLTGRVLREFCPGGTPSLLGSMTRSIELMSRKPKFSPSAANLHEAPHARTQTKLRTHGASARRGASDGCRGS